MSKKRPTLAELFEGPDLRDSDTFKKNRKKVGPADPKRQHVSPLFSSGRKAVKPAFKK